MLAQADNPEIRLFRMKSMGHNNIIGDDPELKITVSHAKPFSPGKYGKPLDGFVISQRIHPTTAPIKTGPQFYWAKTEMTDDTVTVWHPEVKNPRKVQYNWSHYPLGYLANEAGLPASCFELMLEPGDQSY